MGAGDISAGVVTNRAARSIQAMRTVIPATLQTNSARELQATLRGRYRRAPESAWATPIAWTEASGAEASDPFGGTVRLGLAGHKEPFALDESVGGEHDQPSPGELLCGALAACVDASIRLEAARMDLAIERLAVLATGDVDARGSLGEDGVPVGFQSMRVEIQLRLSRASAAVAEKLVAAAQRRSPVLQTLRSAVPVVLFQSEPV